MASQIGKMIKRLWGGDHKHADHVHFDRQHSIPSAAPVQDRSKVAAMLASGRAFAASGKLAEALRCFDQASGAVADDLDALENVAFSYLDIGQVGKAGGVFERMTKAFPASAAAWTNLGNVRYALSQYAEALFAFDKALALDPNSPEILDNFANALEKSGKLSAAIAARRKALSIAPDRPLVLANLAASFNAAGLGVDAFGSYREALKLNPTDRAMCSNYLFSLHYLEQLTPVMISNDHKAWDRAFGGMARHEKHANNPDPARRLRIGYVSADFRRHSCAAFFLPLIANHDKASVHVTCYATSQPDDITARIKSFADEWRQLDGLDANAAAAVIVRDQIDILIDMSGHTAGNRLDVFLLKPAPVQATWLGYAGTTGLSTIDYRITDGLTDPVDAPSAEGSEILQRLPTAWMTFAPWEAPPENARPRKAADAGIVFGSFNALSKLSPATIQCWAEILKAVPDSRLMLKFGALAEPEMCADIVARFAVCGVPAESLLLRARVESTDGHLSLYHEIDIALDPFPYNGNTTTCEALMMNTPVIALRGDRHVGRFGASILTVMGVPELVADDRESYVRLACALAADRPRLEEYHATIAAKFAQSPICDAPAFARGMEDGFRAMWQRWCDAQLGKVD